MGMFQELWEGIKEGVVGPNKSNTEFAKEFASYLSKNTITTQDVEFWRSCLGLAVLVEKEKQDEREREEEKEGDL